ncbi:MAG: hypothetical protein IT336_14975 [Thermomicrobiales bacterium]|nr:hypothetical protein [Thermomicrobiales bacterium]
MSVRRRAQLVGLLLWRRSMPPPNGVPADPATRRSAWRELTLASERFYAAGISQPAAGRVVAPPVAVDGSTPSGGPVLFLNARQAESGAIDGMTLPHDYVLACRFLHCSIIDRTRTLDPGFPYAVLDAMPEPGADGATFAELCDAIGAEIVAEARRTGRNIALLWSGGIDSTCALIAVTKAATDQGCLDRVRVLLSMSSIHEYPGFFLRHIDGRLSVQAVTHPIAEFLDPALLNVTGEHGDQLFGSHLLRSYVRRGVAHYDAREILPLVLLERLRDPRAARQVGRYLAPVIAAAPVPLRSLFDCIWWFNVALKWQEVTLRMAVHRGAETKAVVESFRHFFRDERFQRWALANTPGRPVPTWTSYKQVAKQYIRDATGDEAYYQTKEKEDSLRNVFADPAGASPVRVFMREDLRPVVAPDERTPEWDLRETLRALPRTLMSRTPSR